MVRKKDASFKWIWVITLVVSLAGFPVTRAENLKIGVIFYNFDSFFETIGQGMEAAAAELEGVEVIFGSANIDVDEESRLIDVYLAQHVDAIALSPVDVVGKESLAAIQRAHAAGIPVFCFNGCLTDEWRDPLIQAAFRTKQEDLGYSTGLAVAKWVKQHGLADVKIGRINCGPGCAPRSDGFFNVLTEQGVTYTLVGDSQAENAEVATSAAEAILQAHPEITVLWGENTGGTMGTVKAVRRLGLAGKVVVFGIDMDPEIAGMLLDPENILQAVTAQSPFDMGAVTIESIAAFAHGQAVSPDTWVPGVFFAREAPEAIQQYVEAAKHAN